MKKLESILPTDNYLVFVSSTFGLFVVAALLEIGGGYLVWLWLREKKRIYYGLVGGIILFVYGIIPTLQPSNFGRVYAGYGGIFVCRGGIGIPFGSVSLTYSVATQLLYFGRINLD